MSEDDRGAYVVYGQYRGLIPTGEVSHTISATGREHREEVYETFDNPYRLINREGTRNRRFPKLRLAENRINEARLGKSRVTMVYDDEWAYRQIVASRFPRGLVEQGTSLQSASFVIDADASRGFWRVKGQFTGNISYVAPTKTYRYYSGVPASETRTAGPPPRSVGVSILDVNLGTEGAAMVAVGFDVNSIRPQLTWIRTSTRDGESGGFWTMEETWAQMIRPGYVFKYGNGGGGGSF